MEISEAKEEIQGEALEAIINSNFYCGIILPTGAGKTKVMLRCLSELAERDTLKSIIYCCNSIDLRDKDFPNEVKKWGYSNYLKKMDRICYQSAYKFDGRHYDLALLDEGDVCLSNEYVKFLLNNTFKYLIFVSATLSPDKLILLKSIKPKIPIVYIKELSELEDEGVLNKSKYYYVNFLLNEKENKAYLQHNRTIAGILQNMQNKNSALEFATRRRKLFLNSLKSSRDVCKELLKKIEGRTLVFSELTEQIDAICEYTYHGKNAEDNNLLLFNNGEIDVMGVVGKIDRGVNLHLVQNIVKESGSGSKTKIVQQLGRGKRLSVEEILNVYMLVPYFMPNYPKDTIKPTIVKSWIEKALKDFNIPEIEVFKF